MKLIPRYENDHLSRFTTSSVYLHGRILPLTCVNAFGFIELPITRR